MRQTDAMPFIISTILFVLAIVLVVLTRMRLAKDDAPVAGRLDIPSTLVNAHTAVGGLALVVWGAYLFFDVDWVVGFLGLVLWWATTAIGLLILMRWVPAKGKHAAEGAPKDEWTEGPWLSMVGHLGALVGAIVWTAFFALDKYAS
jgi:hypothetical protein